MKNFFATMSIIIGVIMFMVGTSNIITKANENKYDSSVISYQIRIDSLKTALQKCKDVRISIDFGHRATPQQARAVYTDEQIRRLRKSDLDHIYQTKGRYRTTSDEVFDQRVEDYIDDNIDEIMDKHRD